MPGDGQLDKMPEKMPVKDAEKKGHA